MRVVYLGTGVGLLTEAIGSLPVAIPLTSLAVSLAKSRASELLCYITLSADRLEFLSAVAIPHTEQHPRHIPHTEQHPWQYRMQSSIHGTYRTQQHPRQYRTQSSIHGTSMAHTTHRAVSTAVFLISGSPLLSSTFCDVPESEAGVDVLLGLSTLMSSEFDQGQSSMDLCV